MCPRWVSTGKITPKQVLSGARATAATSNLFAMSKKILKDEDWETGEKWNR